MDINNLNLNVEKELDTFCFENCVLNILKYYKVQNPISYLNASLSIILKKDYIKPEIRSNKTILLINNEKIHNSKHINKPDFEDWDQINNLLDRKIPVILFVDSFYLSYTKVYRKSHGIHTIVLIDNIKDDQYSVLDYGTFCQFFGIVSIDELKLARNSQNKYDGGLFSGIQINNKWKWVERFEYDACEKDLLRKTLISTLNQHFYSCAQDSEYIYGTEITKGIIDIIDFIISTKNFGEYQKTISKLHEISFLISKKYTFFQYYLGNLSVSNQLYEMINICNVIIKKWNLVNIYFIKWNMQLDKFDPRKIIEALNSIMEYDQKIKNIIEKILCEI